ncbi:hypothetical protein AGABI2DRAFT_138309 [Agaricus bisporus var. bisporus H97]|uniref:hypothetical protein n=1 Tax=Agaricus bisporus var. bisporus (strain H97 / ATCC MYA-4626 / FGSC 10389) TaxID=936046 RepID=UPI00029F7D61|nr:hypothetical protein AGABI2DRAFT_138309 [Agaricus bisporus var. bisporus H97]EKV44838.1 hypothetical protein AGABI2DRAFT_138309 [Agaricus bisporus var. bisporus H97]
MGAKENTSANILKVPATTAIGGRVASAISELAGSNAQVLAKIAVAQFLSELWI